MTTIAQKITETRDSINAGPDNIIFARLDALNAIMLAMEVLVQNAGVLTTNQASSGKTLYDIAKEQSEILALCQGARTTDIQDFGNLANTTIYDTGDVDFTFPVSNSTVTSFGVQVLSIDGETEIDFSGTLGATQTITYSNSTTNTFSTYIGDYYLVQSRKTGSLVKATDATNLNAVLRPNAINPLGQDVAFGDDTTNEIGSWNEDYARMDINTLTETDGVKFVTLARPLADGSANSFSPPGLYDALVLKRKINHGDEEAHTQAFVAVVVCEGLQINTNWLPVGDNTGSYAASAALTTNAVKLSDANFKTRADLFYNADYSTNTLPVFKSLANTLVSTSQELPLFSGTYPNKEINPLAPFVYKKKELQPTGLGEGDLFCGRYVHIEAGRQLPGDTDFDSDTGTLTFSGGIDKEYRFVIDTASKYFLQVNPMLTLGTDGVYTTNTVPNANDPQRQFVTGMATIVSTTTGLAHDTTNYPYVNLKCIFSGTTAYSSVSKSFGSSGDANTTYGAHSVSALARSNTSHAGSATATQKLYIDADGQANTTSASATAISLTWAGSDHGVGTNTVTHYYYLPVAGSDQLINYQPHSALYTITRADDGSGGNAYTMTCAVSQGTAFVAPHIFNQLQAHWNKYPQLDAVINGLDSRKTNHDPYFEVVNDGTAINASAQTKYETYYDRLIDLVAKRNAWRNGSSGTHDTYRAAAVGGSSSSLITGSGLEYKADIFDTEFTAFKTSLNTFEASRTERIATIGARIGAPTYANQSPAAQDDSDTKAAYKVSAIPTVDTAVGDADTDVVGITPYGRKLYDVINTFLDSDTGYLRDIMEKINNIQFAFDKINQDRNIYEVLNNRSKQF